MEELLEKKRGKKTASGKDGKSDEGMLGSG